MTPLYNRVMRSVSRERVNRLAHDLLESMLRGRTITLLKDRDVVLQAIAHALGDELKREEEREETVRQRLAAMKKGPPAGSREWEQLFRQMMEQEYVREGLDT